MALSGNRGGAHAPRWRTCLREGLWRHLRSDIFQNASWTLTAQSLQLAGRVGYYVIAARVLGPTGYGTFVACAALIATVSPFASFGTEKLLVKYVARDRNLLRLHFGNALLVTVVFACVLAVLVLCIRTVVLPRSATAAMLAAISIADLFGRKVVDVCLGAFVAIEQFRRYTQLTAWLTALRLAAALVLAASIRTALNWAYLYAVATLIAAATGVVAVILYSGTPHFQLKLVPSLVREGFHFATSAASQSVYNDIDKTMLARLSTIDAAAIYAVAYRLVDAAMVPITSVAAATYPQFFRCGKQGVTGTFSFARRILRRSVIYGAIVALGLYLGAGFVPVIMGRGYQESVPALRWLCVLPAIKSVHAFLSDTLTGADYQWQRSYTQIAVAGFNILINFWIIRAFAWRGAAWSSLASDSLLAVILYIIIRWHLRRERAPSQPTTAQPLLLLGRE